MVSESTRNTANRIKEVISENDHSDIINLGLLLMFKTGVRVGELAALKRSDIHNYTIFINRTETRFVGDDGVKRYSVKDFPKTEAGVLKQCEQNVNVTPKSLHKVRKTYGTILLDSNVKESTILDVMGHADIGVTKDHYYFDRSSVEDKRQELGNVADL